jgi:hypothetical protein
MHFEKLEKHTKNPWKPICEFKPLQFM